MVFGIVLEDRKSQWKTAIRGVCTSLMGTVEECTVYALNMEKNKSFLVVIEENLAVDLQFV